MKITHTLSKSIGLGLLALSASAFLGASAEAAPRKRAPTPRDVQVDNVKEAYWNRTSEGDIEVVQNRQYSKAGRLSLQAYVGTGSTDPFLSVKYVGAALGYHFTEQWGLTAIYRKFLVSDSSYLTEMRNGLTNGAPSGANTNEPDTFMGGEIEFSPFYGKISLSGSSIVHYDAHFLLGGGVIDTESGKYFVPSVGFGPQLYLSNHFALRLDYRFAFYTEKVPQKVLPALGPIAGERTNYVHSGTLGLVLFL